MLLTNQQLENLGLKSLTQIKEKYGSKKRVILEKSSKKKDKIGNIPGINPEILRRLAPQNDSFAIILKQLQELTKNVKKIEKKIGLVERKLGNG